jgi:hypothetical protein
MKEAIEFDSLDLGEGIDWKVIRSPDSYYPTRLEYFAGKAMQGLVIGRSEKDLKHIAARSVQLAKELEQEIDSAQD